MKKTVLITGGAGFIGSHLSDELIAHGYSVRVLDNLLEQVHGSSGRKPAYLNEDVEFINGDVRDKTTLHKALHGVDVVYHFAARVGVGQSMYAIRDYTEVNNIGTAQLLELLIEQPVEKLIVASSMSVYGEGLYRKTDSGIIENADRSTDQLRNGIWELYDENGNILQPVPTPEWKSPRLASVYALGKYDQEQLCLITGKAYGIDTTALRFFNVYGTRQALSNPYTGVLAIFASRYLNNNPPRIFEDGQQRRDFVSVYDVARACRLALESDKSNSEVFNIGSGNSYTVADIAELMGQVLGKDHLQPEITGEYRKGDIRHCYADISKARQILGFTPEVNFTDGLTELCEWLRGQTSNDHVQKASSELLARGLTIKGQILTEIEKS